MNAQKLITSLQSQANKQTAKSMARFFKTGEGEYAQGDIFLGITVPQIRTYTRSYVHLPLQELKYLIRSPFHEIRFSALVILVKKVSQTHTVRTRKKFFDWYMRHVKYINNWDLVDISAPTIVGGYMAHMSQTARKSFIQEMIHSDTLWKNRIIIVATHYDIRKGDVTLALEIARQLLTHPHDLIHKAVGWMLREVGKYDRALLITFLDMYMFTMSRTTLRYAIEHFSVPLKNKYMNLKKL